MWGRLLGVWFGTPLAWFDVKEGPKSSLWFQAMLSFLFIGFVLVRFPLLYSLGGFVLFLGYFVGLSFLSVVVTALFSNASAFFLRFLPEGTPLWMAPVISVLEAISFGVRPFVLVLRPFVNLSLGLAVMQFIVYYGFCSPAFAALFWCCWFLYEIFVCFVQWYIVLLILSFSEKS